MRCRRCGIDGVELLGGFCADCIEVDAFVPEGAESAVVVKQKRVRVIDPANRIKPRKGTGAEVLSIRRSGLNPLTADQRATIVQLKSVGKTTKEIALLIGCSSRTVRNYRVNARGNHVA